MEGRMTVHLIEADSLISADINGKSDPYCLLQLSSGGPVLRSRTVQKTLSPTWDETLTLWYSDRATESLCIRCMDEDKITADDPLGSTRIMLATVAPGPQWYTLDHVKHGRLRLSIELSDDTASTGLLHPTGAWMTEGPEDTDSGEPTEAETRAHSGEREAWNALQEAPSASRYVVHMSTLAGIATSSSSEPYRQYSCYEVEMRGVADVFGSARNRWNEQYAKARKIFGRGASTAVVRGAIHVQHAELYKKGMRGWKSAGGLLRNGADLLSLINYGIRDRAPVMYTYVLLDRAFNFSETGTTFSKDFMSKHAMHANAAREVRYAGEFIVHKHTLVLDNNSGTYAPDPKHLPLLVEVFKRNFPGLDVEAYDRDDKKLAEYKSVIKQEQERTQQPQAQQCTIA
eukprot:m51a1_g1301 hypothetical protein (401) ;mRNA; f:197771-199424